MEVLFDLKAVFGNNQPIVKITGEWVTMRNARKFPAIADVVNALGEESAFSQGLRGPVTSYEKMYNSDYLLYIWWEPHPTNASYGLVMGFAKVGRKSLYLFDRDGKCVKCNPVCLLDFYVVQSQQRKGYGLALLQHVMQENGLTHPWEIAVDRPSSLYYAFMHRHFNLPKSAAIEQPNHFVVYAKFFDPDAEDAYQPDSAGQSHSTPPQQRKTDAGQSQSRPQTPNRHAFVRLPGDQATPSNYQTAKSRYLSNLGHSPAW